MDTFQIVFLALVQGLTEFLPVSSSAHLVLVSPVLGWPDQGLLFDIAVHLGTLFAVLAYYHRDLLALAANGVRRGPEQQEILMLGVATIPAVVAGFTLGDWLETWTRAPWVIATTTVVFGLLLAVADRRGQAESSVKIGLAIALGIGLAQMLALIPGTSRSGITITAALLFGLSRTQATRFSFLLSIPIIAGAALLMTKDALETGLQIQWSDLGLGVAVAFIAALVCIKLFVQLVERIGMMPFVIYRLILGGALFIFLV